MGAVMDWKDTLDLTRSSPEIIPSLLKSVDARSVAGFDTTATPRSNPDVPEASSNVIQVNQLDTLPEIIVQKLETHHNRTISISMPSSPSALFIEQVEEDQAGDNRSTEAQRIHFTNKKSSGFVPSKHYSQPMPLRSKDVPETKLLESTEHQQRVPRVNKLKDKRYDSFKTWSGKLERQISTLRGKPQEKREITEAETTEPTKTLPAIDRYFDALEGPELDKLRASEELVLPEDNKWPFLLRYPMSSFGICLGVSSQAMLWKALATSPSTSFLHISLKVNFILWCISLALMVVVSAIYAMKIIFYFEAVRREYYHPIRVNFFFAPWITCLFLAIGAPPIVADNMHASVWYVLMIPILMLEVKIYGQWMSGGQRRLSKVANPSNHLSVIGNFVGALLGASMGLKEGPIFFFGVGLAHYIVLFVTLYQRLPTNETLPKDLHPVFFLFVAAPSVASMAWAKITGEFSYGSKLAFFVSLFLYASLAVRLNFFRGFRFSLAWWAYTFPMTGAAVATIRYSTAVPNVFTQCLSVALSAIATLTVTALLITTIIYAFVLHDLFPNDIAIAITNTKKKPSKMHFHIWKPNSENKDTEAQKNLEGKPNSENKDIEAQKNLEGH